MTRLEAMEVLKKGEEFTFEKTVSEADVYLFAGITGDFHPNHTNEEYAKKTQLGRRVAHGALMVGYAAACAAQAANKHRNPGSASFRYDIKFVSPVYIGDTIKVSCIVGDNNYEKFEIPLETKIYNQHGEVTCLGTCYIRILKN